jgi:high-affinity nickel-transport protein
VIAVAGWLIMLGLIRRAVQGGEGRLAREIAILGTGLVLFNLLAWAWAWLAFRDHPMLLGTGLLAYGFGLRHAVDADHITAIDNVTRKLMQEGKRATAAGFYFSLGHSTVVILASVALAIATSVLQDRLAAFKTVGGAIGTAVSVLFLFAIAAVNLVIMVGVYRSLRRVRRGGALVDDDLDALLAQRGFLARLFRAAFRLVRATWQMYPLGFLFGLGFDTATEIGLLGISATEASRGLSIWSILVFPALFTAGMSLVDTADSFLMVGAYGWALVKPARKLYYNLAITFVSVVVALTIGGIEALGLVADHLDLDGGVREWIGALNDNLGLLGILVIGVFAASWGAAALIYRLGRYDETEAAAQLDSPPPR